jgi:hypothetical protein
MPEDTEELVEPGRMTRGGGVHTVPAAEKPGWWNKLDGRVLSRHRLKIEAVRAGREMARLLRVEHTIHREDGQISEKNSYGNDPFPPKDGK